MMEKILAKLDKLVDRPPWVVWHEVESVEKRDHGDAWVEPESAVEHKHKHKH